MGSQRFRGLMAAVFSAAFLAGAPALAQTDEAMQILQGGQTQRIAPIGGELAMPTPEATPLSGTTPVSERALTPFGSSLFEQQSLTARSQAINPGYLIAPGDQVQVAVWGAWEFTGTLTVDLQGNIFLPEIGPIRVSGLPNQGLDQAVRRGIARVFTGNVHSYTNLLTSQPISVFVTGAVMRPGRYAGARLDTLLYYLAAAGGINPRAGSYRHVSVLRGGRELARVDLYDFILNGRMPEIQFTDNDTVVVAPLGPTIEVHGDVRNSHIFEVAPEVTTGAQVMAVAGPNPSASHVAVSGLRDGQPYNAYVPLDQFAKLRVRDGDNYTFQTDRVDQTIFVSVTGHAGGPSSFAVRRAARLGEVLNLIAIDPDRADLDAIYLRRKSAAERQARALEVSLQELQRSVLLTSSDTPSEAAIRVQEAQLVERFIGKARAVEPEGRVVLGNRQGHMDLRLEPEDEIVIPLRSDVILVSGEVRAPQSLLYVPGRSVREYIADAGGLTERGGSDMYVVQRLNGTVETTSSPELRPGDHVMILPKVDSKAGAVFKDIVEIIYRIAVSSGVVINILDDK